MSKCSSCWSKSSKKKEEKGKIPRKNDPTELALSAWWFGTSILFFPSYWECHHPNWLIYFSEGLVETTKQLFFWVKNWSQHVLSDWGLIDWSSRHEIRAKNAILQRVILQRSLWWHQEKYGVLICFNGISLVCWDGVDGIVSRRHTGGIDSGNMSIVGEPRKLTMSSSRIAEAQRVDLNVWISTPGISCNRNWQQQELPTWPFFGEVPVRFLSICARWLLLGRIIIARITEVLAQRAIHLQSLLQSTCLIMAEPIWPHLTPGLCDCHGVISYIGWSLDIVGIYPVYRSSIMFNNVWYLYL